MPKRRSHRIDSSNKSSWVKLNFSSHRWLLELKLIHTVFRKGFLASGSSIYQHHRTVDIYSEGRVKTGDGAKMRSVVHFCVFISSLANVFSSDFLFRVSFSMGDLDDCTSPISGRVDKLNTCTPASEAYQIITATSTAVTRTIYGDSSCKVEIVSTVSSINSECSSGVKNFISTSYALPYPLQHIGARQVDNECLSAECMVFCGLWSINWYDPVLALRKHCKQNWHCVIILSTGFLLMERLQITCYFVELSPNQRAFLLRCWAIFGQLHHTGLLLW